MNESQYFDEIPNSTPKVEIKMKVMVGNKRNGEKNESTE